MCDAIRGKKISGTVLLSHSQICSTIAAEVLNYRVREGNVCDYLAISTGKYYNEEKLVLNEQLNITECLTCVESHLFLKFLWNLRKKVVKPHG